jgi:anaerobic magnesium-protoporphyrin IX monomethyl ester cyclase
MARALLAVYDNESFIHEALLDANGRLISNYYNRKLELTLEEARRLYLDQDSRFRGFRQS